jgi:hypothetical protein
VQQPRPDGQPGNQNAVKQPRKLLCVLAVLTLDLVASSGRPGAAPEGFITRTAPIDRQ